MARMCEGATTDDYRKAVSGDDDVFGLGAQWSDKPHRLVYDLCGEVEALRDSARNIVDEVNAAVKAERMRCAYIVATKFEEARDTEFDLGFETARKVFVAAILNPPLDQK